MAAAKVRPMPKIALPAAPRPALSLSLVTSFMLVACGGGGGLGTTTAATDGTTSGGTSVTSTSNAAPTPTSTTAASTLDIASPTDAVVAEAPVSSPVAAPAAAPAAEPAPAPAATGGFPTVASLGTLQASGGIVAQSGQTIRGMKITNPSGPCIHLPSGTVNVTIEGNEIGPCGPSVDHVGIEIQPNSSNIVMRGNVIHDVPTGVFALTARHPIIFEGNTVYNVRGPMPRGQMIQFNGVRGGSGQSRIVGNLSDQLTATIQTQYEDHISMFDSYGSAGSPILIACNKIRGGNSLTGSGIMVGDSGGAYFEVRDNILVHPANVGLGIAGGQNVTMSNNIIYSRGGAQYLAASVMAVFSYSGFTPGNIVLSNNRGAVDMWRHDQGGNFVDGFFSDGTAFNFTQTGNNWMDASLTEDVWNQTPAGC